MKKVIFLLLLLVAQSAAIFANITDNQSEDRLIRYFDAGNPIEFDGKEYYLAWSSHPYDIYYLQEYLPKGETFDSLTNMITVAVLFYGDIKDVDAGKLVDAKISELEARKKTDKVCNYQLLENGNEYLLDFIVSQSDGKGNLECVELNLHHYKDMEIDGKRANCLVFYSRRAYGDDILPFMKTIPTRRPQWIESLTTLPLTPSFKPASPESE